MSKKRKIILVLLAFLIIVGSGAMIYLFRNSINDTVSKIKKEKKYTDKIKDYDYTLEDRDTELFTNTFKSLRKVLSNSEVDYEEYAKLLGELYIIDLYTINNKENKYDVGGSDYVFPDVKDNYELKVKDTLYKYIEDNSDGKRTQNLPEVSSILASNLEKGTYKYSDKEFESYQVDYSFEYKKDLGYDKKATLIMIKDGKMLYVIEQK